jgi:hypothetical protein
LAQEALAIINQLPPDVVELTYLPATQRTYSKNYARPGGQGQSRLKSWAHMGFHLW